jgi:NADH-quinone oxidoreductase subunit M
MINHGISTGALFLLVGIVYERRHTRMISEYGGLAKQMPVYAVFFLVMAMSSMGLPLLNGFVGEFTILNGAYLANPWYAFWALWGVVLGAAYLLWLYQRVFFGELANPANQSLPDMNAREQWTLIPLVVCALWIGLYPQPFFDVIARPVDRIVSAVEGASAAPRTNAALSAGTPASAGASAAR